MKLVAKFLHIIGMMYRDQELVLQISTTDFSGFCESWLVTMFRLSYRGCHQIIIICLEFDACIALELHLASEMIIKSSETGY